MATDVKEFVFCSKKKLGYVNALSYFAFGLILISLVQNGGINAMSLVLYAFIFWLFKRHSNILTRVSFDGSVMQIETRGNNLKYDLNGIKSISVEPKYLDRFTVIDGGNKKREFRTGSAALSVDSNTWYSTHEEFKSFVEKINDELAERK